MLYNQQDQHSIDNYLQIKVLPVRVQLAIILGLNSITSSVYFLKELPMGAEILYFHLACIALWKKLLREIGKYTKYVILHRK